MSVCSGAHVVWPDPTERSKLLIILLIPNSKLPLLQYNVPITKLRMTVWILCLLSSWNAMRSSSFSTRRSSCNNARHKSHVAGHGSQSHDKHLLRLLVVADHDVRHAQIGECHGAHAEERRPVRFSGLKRVT
jgi:hypothetical protein